jgi:hypothetical protein
LVEILKINNQLTPIRVSDERDRNNNKNVDDKIEDFDEPSKNYPVNSCSKYILIAGVTVFLTILVLIYNSHKSYSELEDGTIDAADYNMTNTPSVTPTRITKSPLPIIILPFVFAILFRFC